MWEHTVPSRSHPPPHLTPHLLQNTLTQVCVEDVPQDNDVDYRKHRHNATRVDSDRVGGRINENEDRDPNAGRDHDASPEIPEHERSKNVECHGITKHDPVIERPPVYRVGEEEWGVGGWVEGEKEKAERGNNKGGRSMKRV